MKKLNFTVRAATWLCTFFFVIGTVSAQTEIKLNPSAGRVHESFGASVSISTDWAVIGAPYWTLEGSGSAYIFRRDGSSWVEEAKLGSSDGEAGDDFGHSVSINGGRIIVGAPGDDDNGTSSGSACTFKRDGTTTWIEEAKLTPSDGAAFEFFGMSVSISGDRVIVGAPVAGDKGAAYVFQRNDTAWIEEAKLIASDGETGDEFGFSVCISQDLCIIGAPRDNDHGTESGSAYLFRREGQNWVEETKLTASNASANDNFGCSVSIDRSQAIVGARYGDGASMNSGSAYIFCFNETTWTEESKLGASDPGFNVFFGWSVSISGNHAIVGASLANDSGAAYIFRRNGLTWLEEAKLIASDGAAEDFFGWSVSISEFSAIVGATGDDDNGDHSGSAYIYEPILGPLEEHTPVITNIIDVPNDQGKQARVSWMKSALDGVEAGVFSVAEYSLWRRVDTLPDKCAASTSEAGMGGGDYDYIDPDFEMRYSDDMHSLFNDSLPPGEWDFILAVPSIGSETYNVVAPTLADSTIAHGMHWSVFTVVAHAANPLIFYVSAADSGYSLDNLVPHKPEGLSASVDDNAIALTWKKVPDEDFNYHAIYRDTQSGFDPHALDPYATTVDAFFTDTEVDMDTLYFYRVSAFDFSGNQGEFSEEVAAIVTAINYDDYESAVPRAYALSQNYPNPFNPSTEISYAIPKDVHVTLKVYNVLCAEVATLVDADQKANFYTVTWDAGDLASGIYFCTMRAGESRQTRKMVLLK